MSQMFKEPVTRSVVVFHKVCGSTVPKTSTTTEVVPGECTGEVGCRNHKTTFTCPTCGEEKVSDFWTMCPVVWEQWSGDVQHKTCGCRVDWSCGVGCMTKWCGHMVKEECRCRRSDTFK